MNVVVLFNLGGPDRPDSVEPFLFNLFNDKAIIRLPQPLRWLVAKLISKRRAPIAKEIYAKLGGGSPLLANTQAQARALEQALGPEWRVLIAMRYWHPFAAETVAEIAKIKPRTVVLLPLYPQFSTTTVASSHRDWALAAAKLEGTSVTVCCYPALPGLIEAMAELTAAEIKVAATAGRPRVLFTAHGLPKKVVASGDPYPDQVQDTARALLAQLEAMGIREFDHRVCYQSRVGPLEWIGPATDEEIRAAGRDRVPLVVVPVAFVSEHSETLVELDIEYRHLAEASGVPLYRRAGTVGTHAKFINGLAKLVLDILGKPGTMCVHLGQTCPAEKVGCPVVHMS
ncbi:MAG: ferrochelatase [Alphaproteobacteria bacterium]|nr:ferrochelatase [Alphaproteobacteria bacterium]